MSDNEDAKVFEKEDDQNIVKYIYDLSKEMNIDDTCGIVGNELELIALVRNCRFLYDKNLSDFKDVRKKSIAWSAIASVMHCKVYEVQQRWRSLREAYNKYKKEIDISEEVHNSTVRSWDYYEEMKFIDTHIVHRRSSNKGSSGSYRTDIEPNVSNDDTNSSDRTTDTVRLILCIKERPILYDNKHPNYKIKGLKTEAWNEVAQAMGVSVDDCELKWRNLRERYGRERKVKQVHIDRKPWEYSEALNFLDAHIKPRKHSFHPILPKLDSNINNLAIISPLNTHTTSKNQSVMLNHVIKNIPSAHESGQKSDNESIIHLHPHYDIQQVEFVDASNTSTSRSATPTHSAPKIHYRNSFVNSDQNHIILHDEDELFGQSISAELRRIPSGKKKMKIKSEIYKILYENESDN